MMQNVVYFIDFILLFLVSYHIRQRYLRGCYSTTSAAVVVMAIGLFALSVLPFFPPEIAILRPYFTLELLIIWFFIAESYIQCYLHQHFYIHTRNILNHFNIGTWIISTVYLSLLWFKSFSGLDEVGIFLALIAVCVWIEYMHIMINDLHVVVRNPIGMKLTGSIFLLTVSIQSIAILLNSVLDTSFPLPIFIILIILGFFYYAVCFILLLKNYFQAHFHHVIVDWPHSNSLLHGALSITGLACLKTGDVSPAVIVSTWIAAAILFVLVEGIALLSMLFNIVKEGAKAALWKYDLSQWVRSYAYGLFFAFSIAIERMQFPLLKPVTFFIIQYGKYVIAGLLLVEVVLFCQARLQKPVVVKETLQYRDVKK